MAAMKKAMKAMKAMKSMKKAMKSMKKGMKKSSMKGMRRKAMKKSKVAKGKRAKSSVFRGTKEKTSGGLKKTDLTKNSNGKVVSKKASTAGKKRYGNIKAWIVAVGKARKAMGIKGFCAVGGKSTQGQALYKKAKSFWKK